MGGQVRHLMVEEEEQRGDVLGEGFAGELRREQAPREGKILDAFWGACVVGWKQLGGLCELGRCFLEARTGVFDEEFLDAGALGEERPERRTEVGGRHCLDLALRARLCEAGLVHVGYSLI